MRVLLLIATIPLSLPVCNDGPDSKRGTSDLVTIDAGPASEVFPPTFGGSNAPCGTYDNPCAASATPDAEPDAGPPREPVEDPYARQTE